MAGFCSKVMGRKDDEPPVLVASEQVDIRSGPGVEFAPIPGSPLAKGVRARLLRSQGIWHYVDVVEPAGSTVDLAGSNRGTSRLLPGDP